jgi:short-subunit dehydrogenase
VNLWGPIHGCHVFVPMLRAAGRGGVINVASAASFAAAPNMGPYSVSKAAVLSLTETLAAELAGSGLAATAVCPTFVKTNIARDGRIDAGASGSAERLMRLTGWSPERIVRAALAANDRGQLYVVPQPDAQLLWHAKRYLPATYTRAMGLAGRFTRGTPEPADTDDTGAISAT